MEKPIPKAWRRAADALDGSWTGAFDPSEYEYLIEAGLLRKSFEGAGGLLGLSHLRRVYGHD